MKQILRNFYLELARRANNGELFNRNQSRDGKDALAVYFWRKAERFKEAKQ